jgi:hypothetical protein
MLVAKLKITQICIINLILLNFINFLDAMFTKFFVYIRVVSALIDRGAYLVPRVNY